MLGEKPQCTVLDGLFLNIIKFKIYVKIYIVTLMHSRLKIEGLGKHAQLEEGRGRTR